MTIDEILNISPFSLNKDKKEEMLTKRLLELTNLHIKNCPEYASIMRTLSYNDINFSSYYDIPFLPVSLFKELELKSITNDNIFKIMTSSGTSGNAVSKIYLDKITAGYQQKALVSIVSDYIGQKRMPMLIIDSPSIIKNREMFSARGAGILGFMIFGADKVYALDDDMKLDLPSINAFLEKHDGKSILLFGFTFMVWQHFIKELEKREIKLNINNGTLIHGGGWKKLQSEKISKEEYKNTIEKMCGFSNIYDYYGMVEQTGSIYIECSEGHLHTSIFSDIIIRRAKDFGISDIGEKGIIQVVSVLPESYPGHSLLTEDEGILLGEDDCPCGRFGKYFKILGRLANAELRGCSDTFAATV